MAHGYGFWTFGWLQAERESARIERFNERWTRLQAIQCELTRDFLRPIYSASDQLTPREHSKLANGIGEMNNWRNVISENIDIARQQHLSRYARVIRQTAIHAAQLFKKYKFANENWTFEYDSLRKMLVVNGIDRFFFA